MPPTRYAPIQLVQMRQYMHATPHPPLAMLMLDGWACQSWVPSIWILRGVLQMLMTTIPNRGWRAARLLLPVRWRPCWRDAPPLTWWCSSRRRSAIFDLRFGCLMSNVGCQCNRIASGMRITLETLGDWSVHPPILRKDGLARYNVGIVQVLLVL